MKTEQHKLYLAIRAALAVSAGIGVALPTAVRAAEGGSSYSYNWNTGNGVWETATNWGPGTPTGTPGNTPGIPGDNVNINSTAAATITYQTATGTRTIASLFVGNGSVPAKTLNITGGDLTDTGSANVAAGGVGVVNQLILTGGAFHSTGASFSNSASVNSASKVTVAGGTLTSVNFSNAFNATGGAALLTLSSGTVSNTTNFNNNGTVAVTGSGTLSAGNFKNNATGKTTVSGSGVLTNTGATGSNAGSITLTGGSFVNSGTFANTATVTNSGGAIDNTGGTLTNSGTVTVTGSGSLSGGTITNTGTVNVAGGTFGNSSTTVNQNGGTLAVSNAATNSVGTLNITGGTVNVAGGSDKIAVNSDYSNANFNTGNAFNARANVTGSGIITAAGTARQGLSVNGGAATNAGTVTLALGNVHIGDTVSQNYQIANTGASGPSIRGAIQTVGTGNITDGRLSGSGVTAGNYTSITGAGALATGASTANYGVTFTASSAGALTGQAVQVVNNFGDKQTLSIDGAGWRLASAGNHSPEPVNLGNVHVGDTFGTQALSVQNTAASDGFSEKLNASIGGATGQASASGSFSLLGAQATNNSGLTVGLGGAANTGTVGAKSGTATISFVSDGQASGTPGNSGLGQTALTGQNQTVTVQGEVWRLASASPHTPEPVSLDAVHVGGTFGTQALSIQNTAASDGWSEKLNAGFGATTGQASASGSFSLLDAQATDNSSLVVGLGGAANTGTAGTKSGTATITLVSDGQASGTSGNSGLGQTTLTGQSQTVNVSGDVYNYAQAALGSASGASLSPGGTATAYTLNFGSLSQNTGIAGASLHIENVPAGLTDLLQGSWSTVSGSGFTYNPLSFSNIAGGSFDIFNVNFNTNVALGLWQEQIRFVWDGFNAVIGGGWQGTADGQNTTREILLNLSATVIEQGSGTIPEPNILLLFGSAGVGAWLASRRRKHG